MFFPKTVLALLASVTLGLNAKGSTPIFNLSQAEIRELNAHRYAFADLSTLFNSVARCPSMLMPRASEYELPFPYMRPLCGCYANREAGLVRFEGGIPEEWPSALIPLEEANLLFFTTEGDNLNGYEMILLREWHRLNPFLRCVSVAFR